MNHREIVAWLRQSDPARLDELWHRADDARRRFVGDEVHLRGLIEFSNHCAGRCEYCGLRAANRKLTRYRMSEAEIMVCVHQAVSLGYGTVVLQSGDDPNAGAADRMSRLVRRIKTETPLAVTLSLGERSDEELAAWRDAGADRYLLRFETSNRALYDRIHPARDGAVSDRLALLGTLERLGYEVGSGVMIGIPGQSHDDLARDIERFAALDLDMIGVGPYLVHPNTPLADPSRRPVLDDGEQVPADELTTYKVIALTRLVCPRANIPATTALATIGGQAGWESGLERGANVIMPNLTPPHYRRLYDIYPDKACIADALEARGESIPKRIAALGRSVGNGRGDSPNYLQKKGSELFFVALCDRGK